MKNTCPYAADVFLSEERITDFYIGIGIYNIIVNKK